MDKVIKYPLSYKEKTYNSHGVGYVPCEVSGRWLQFADTYDQNLGFVFVDVMTDAGDGGKKLCSLCVNINDLRSEINKIKPV